ncbi:MAG: methylthioribulose 1-phosphate dehydratase [Candidatus Eremiobacteraeota bacterium]|nr:methylthioribulose 1-phosphate dehydratase [Candidatus Eremiobacteraeota bacterium]
MLGVLARDQEAVAAVIGAGRFASRRGWMPATSGNISARINDRLACITRSGVDKGDLVPGDVMTIALDAPLPAGCSAETPLHVARYCADRSIGAILHVHSVEATVLSRRFGADGSLTIDGYEMAKAFNGVTTHETSIRVPIFANAQDTARLAQEIEAALGAGPSLPAYLLEGHGIYTWGASMNDARRHLEALQFLLECTLEERRSAT